MKVRKSRGIRNEGKKIKGKRNEGNKLKVKEVKIQK